MSRPALRHQSSGTIFNRHLIVRILRCCVCARARSTGRRPVLGQTRLLRQAPLENWDLAIGIHMRSRHVRDSCGWSASRTPGSAAGFPKPQTAEAQRPQTAEPQRPQTAFGNCAAGFSAVCGQRRSLCGEHAAKKKAVRRQWTFQSKIWKPTWVGWRAGRRSLTAAWRRRQTDQAAAGRRSRRQPGGHRHRGIGAGTCA